MAERSAMTKEGIGKMKQELTGISKEVEL